MFRNKKEKEIDVTSLNHILRTGNTVLQEKMLKKSMTCLMPTDFL